MQNLEIAIMVDQSGNNWLMVSNTNRQDIYYIIKIEELKGKEDEAPD